MPCSSSLDSHAKICHFHSKLMQKEPRVGGAWEWHQDYGYWYKNQFMFPDELISVMIALTPANRENGCLQVIQGSHKMGRVNHGFTGEQVGADMEMVNNALKTHGSDIYRPWIQETHCFSTVIFYTGPKQIFLIIRAGRLFPVIVWSPISPITKLLLPGIFRLKWFPMKRSWTGNLNLFPMQIS